MQRFGCSTIQSVAADLPLAGAGVSAPTFDARTEECESPNGNLARCRTRPLPASPMSTPQWRRMGEQPADAGCFALRRFSMLGRLRCVQDRTTLRSWRDEGVGPKNLAYSRTRLRRGRRRFSRRRGSKSQSVRRGWLARCRHRRTTADNNSITGRQGSRRMLDHHAHTNGRLSSIHPTPTGQSPNGAANGRRPVKGEPHQRAPMRAQRQASCSFIATNYLDLEPTYSDRSAGP